VQLYDTRDFGTVQNMKKVSVLEVINFVKMGDC
jgi:hypothetical protein